MRDGAGAGVGDLQIAGEAKGRIGTGVYLPRVRGPANMIAIDNDVAIWSSVAYCAEYRSQAFDAGTLGFACPVLRSLSLMLIQPSLTMATDHSAFS